MMGACASNEKYKFELLNARLKIYRHCDEQNRNILEARTYCNIILKIDNDQYPLRTKLLEKIIKLIATESIPEKTDGK